MDAGDVGDTGIAQVGGQAREGGVVLGRLHIPRCFQKSKRVFCIAN